MSELDLFYSAELGEYDFGPHHPMAPIRLALTFELIRAFALPELPQVRVCAPPVASDAELLRVHTPDYVAAIKAASRGRLVDGAEKYGLATADCPPFAGMHRAAARLAGGTLAACRAVMDGAPSRAVNFAGGMHHAMPGAAAGFCIYNDAAVGIADLLDRGVERVVYIDLDAHHGDGVERIFRDDRRVTTISIHQHPDTLFPHTGYPQDIGGTDAKGHAINLCLPPRTGDAGALRAVEAIVEPVLAEIRPDVVVTQHGCDGHVRDPLTDLAWSVDGMAAAARLLRDLIGAHSAGRWVALGGGGYAVCSVPPRTWTLLVSILADADLDPGAPLPRSFYDLAATSPRCGGAAHLPATLGDGVAADFTPFAYGFNPADPIDRAINATRSSAFPELGIDPMTL